MQTQQNHKEEVCERLLFYGLSLKLKKADPNNEYVKRVRSDPRFEILRTLQLIPEFETVALAKEIQVLKIRKNRLWMNS